MEPDGSSPCLQQPASCPYPQADEFSPRSHPIYLVSFSHLRVGLPICFFPSVFLQNPDRIMFQYASTQLSCTTVCTIALLSVSGQKYFRKL